MRQLVVCLAVGALFTLASCGQAVSVTSSTAPASVSTSVPTEATQMSTTVATPEASQTGAAATFDDDYLAGGPGRGFVVLDDPEMVMASEATWLLPDEIVLGVVHPSGAAQAFPIGQMAYHHIANTTIAGEPYLVTY